METRNAIIESARLHISERFGGLTAAIVLAYGGCLKQQFAGHVLHLPPTAKHFKLETVAGHFIFRVLEIAGVDDWSLLPGRTIRVRCDWTSVEAIGHIVNDDWFNPRKDFAVLRPSDDANDD